MNYELLIRGRAKRDVRRAAKWYERQHEGLGKEFVIEVDAALERIAGNPEQYEVVHREIRHCILRRFPYELMRTHPKSDELWVQKIAEQGRNTLPKEIRGRDS